MSEATDLAALQTEQVTLDTQIAAAGSALAAVQTTSTSLKAAIAKAIGDEPAAPPTTPGPVANLVATAGNTTAAVSWTAPSGATATSYLIAWNNGGNSFSSAVTSVVVTGLTNGTPYSFTVTSSNSSGSGPAVASNLVIPAATPTPTPSPTPTPTPTPSGLPYPGSFWYRPIGSNPALAASSAAYVARWVKDYTTYYPGSPLGPNPDDETFTYNLYIVDASTPLVNVTIKGHSGSWAGTIQAPIPAGAKFNTSADGGMALWDGTTNWEFWGGTGSAGSYSALTYVKSLTAAPNTGAFQLPGSNGQYGGAAASGLSYLAGLIKPSEIAAGVIPHAVLSGTVSTNGFVAPATRTDGGTSGGIPEGTRFFLPASVAMPSTVAADPVQKAVFTAVQTYGMILTDTAGSCNVYFASGQSYSPDPWSIVKNLAGIPWAQMEVLAPAS